MDLLEVVPKKNTRHPKTSEKKDVKTNPTSRRYRILEFRSNVESK